MKTIEELAYEAYEANEELPVKYQIGDDYWMDWYKKGFNEALKWHDINDKDTPIPKDEDILIKLEDGSIVRYFEEWEDRRLLVTHWRRLNNS